MIVYFYFFLRLLFFYFTWPGCSQGKVSRIRTSPDNMRVISMTPVLAACITILLKKVVSKLNYARLTIFSVVLLCVHTCA